MSARSTLDQPLFRISCQPNLLYCTCFIPEPFLWSHQHSYHSFKPCSDHKNGKSSNNTLIPKPVSLGMSIYSAAVIPESVVNWMFTISGLIIVVPSTAEVLPFNLSRAFPWCTDLNRLLRLLLSIIILKENVELRPFQVLCSLTIAPRILA